MSGILGIGMGWATEISFYFRGVSILGEAQAISTPLSSVVLFLPDRSFRGWPKSGLIFRTAVVGTQELEPYHVTREP